MAQPYQQQSGGEGKQQKYGCNKQHIAIEEGIGLHQAACKTTVGQKHKERRNTRYPTVLRIENIAPHGVVPDQYGQQRRLLFWCRNCTPMPLIYP